jgi:hypothetical protein
VNVTIIIANILSTVTIISILGGWFYKALTTKFNSVLDRHHLLMEKRFSEVTEEASQKLDTVKSYYEQRIDKLHQLQSKERLDINELFHDLKERQNTRIAILESKNEDGFRRIGHMESKVDSILIEMRTLEGHVNESMTKLESNLKTEIRAAGKKI